MAGHLKPKKGISSERIEMAKTSAACVLIVTNQVADSYRYYINSVYPEKSLTEKNRTSATLFFQRDDMQAKVQLLKSRMAERMAIDYLYELGISKADIDILIQKSKNKKTEDLTRDYLTSEMKNIIETTDNEVNKISAAKLLYDAEALKKKDKVDDGSVHITYHLPLPLCDNCEKSKEMISRYQDEERILEIIDEIDEESEVSGVELPKELNMLPESGGLLEKEEYIEEAPEEL